MKQAVCVRKRTVFLLTFTSH